MHRLQAKMAQLSFPTQQCNPHATYVHTLHSACFMAVNAYNTHSSTTWLQGVLTVTTAIKLDWTSTGPYVGPGIADVHDVSCAVTKVQVQRAIQVHIIHI